MTWRAEGERRILCYLIVVLLLALAAGDPGNLLGFSAPPSQLDGSAVNASTAAAVQDHFMAAIRLADDLYDTTADEKASIALLRAALTGCPGCPLTHPGRWSRPVFNVDHFDNRLMLYGQILPQVYRQNVKDVLWVGVQPYTLRHEYLFAKQGIIMTSLEADPENELYGSSHLHIVAPVQHLGQFIANGSFDAVIINGVIGWGVDADQDVADTLSVLHGALRDRGLLVVGYNKPTNFRYWAGGLLPLFDNATLGSLPHEVDVQAEFHHVYEFFTKAAGTHVQQAHGFHHSPPRARLRHCLLAAQGAPEG